MPTESWTSPGSYEWTVPDGITEVTIRCWGGGQYFSGGGGKSVATISVSSGDTLYPYVGGRGGNEGGSGGFNGGGSAGSGSAGDADGGSGASDVRLNGESLSDRIIVAGGAGGTASDANDEGGAGGGANQSGTSGIRDYGGGGGGTLSSGGAGGSADYNGEDGSLGQGGAGADGGGSAGGGGGGGYYGGGGGGVSYSSDDTAGCGGGGGSGWVISSATNVSGSRGVHEGHGTVEIEYTEPPATPTVDNVTVAANDQVDLSFTGDTSAGSNDNYRIQMQRDGGSWVSPSGGSTTPSSDGTHSYTPNSDNSYASQVGIDSSFRFRVRSENSVGNSDWVYSNTVKTDPLPPHNPSISRPDANTIKIHGEVQSDISSKIRVQFREDTGSGYGSWTNYDLVAENDTNQLTSGSVRNKGSSFTFTYETGTSYPGDSGNQLKEDARYQFRLRTWNDPSGDNRKTSEWVYADYGNEGNVYFEDDFEDNGLSEWSSTNLVGESGVKQGTFTDSDTNYDQGVTSPDQGSYWLFLESGSQVTKDLGDLSSESDVIVKAAISTGSMDTTGENTSIDWYDGSSWQSLRSFYHEYNKQGWVEVTAEVPSSYLSTDNRVRFSGYGGSGDYFAVDRVVVSDILHEFTEPSAPSNLSSDASTEKEIGVSWTNNGSFTDRYDLEIKQTSDSSWSVDGTNYPEYDNPEYTFTGLLDGERYNIRMTDIIRQPRRGSITDWWTGTTDFPDTTTVLPAPSGLTASYQRDDRIDLGWTDNSNNETNFYIHINRNESGYVEPNGGPTSPGTDATSATFNPHNSTGSKIDFDSSVGVDSKYTFRIRSETDHTESSWVTSNTVHTTAIPPYNPSINRPDANTIEFSFDVISDIASGIVIEAREDTGSGYGDWSQLTVNETTSGTASISMSTGDGENITLSEDAKYQFRAKTYVEENRDRDSEWVYFDYGNDGNVYFSDNFSSGGAGSWDSNGIGTGGIVDTLDGAFSNGTQSPETGGYAVQMGDSGWLTKDLGDLSGETDVFVFARLQTASNDGDSEEGRIQWYDGSAWQNLDVRGHEWDGQGWMYISAEVSDSMLNSDSRVRVGRNEGGGADWVAFDEVIVADLCHEPTKPAAPSDLLLDANTEREITATWTENHTFDPGEVNGHAKATITPDDSQNIFNSGESYTGLSDGEQYTVEVYSRYDNIRHGERQNHFESDHITATETTLLPPPSNPEITDITDEDISLTWSNTQNNASGHDIYRTSDDFVGHVFDSSGQEITASNKRISDAWNNQRKFTISIDFRIDTINNPDSTWDTILQLADSPQGTIRFERNSSDNDTVRWTGSRVGGNTNYHLGNFPGLSHGEVYTLTLVVDYPNTGEARSYINKEQVFTDADPGDSVDWDVGELRLSHEGWADFGARRLTIWNRALSEDEIAAHCDGKLVEDGLMAFWPFGHEENGTTPDMSPFPNDATVNGPTQSGSWTLDGTVGANESQYTTTAAPSANSFRAKVVTHTEHAQVESDTLLDVLSGDETRRKDGATWANSNNINLTE